MADNQFSFDLESFQSAPEFEGEIVEAAQVEGKFGAQVHIAVKPYGRALAGKSGAFHSYYPMSMSKRGRLFLFLKAMAEKVGIKLERGQDISALVGVQATWTRRDFKYGKDDAGDDIIVEGVLMPVGPYKGVTPRDVEDAAPRPKVQGAVETPANDPEFDRRVAEFVAGNTEQGVYGAAAKALGDGSVDKAVAQAALNGATLKRLVESGQLALANGVYTLNGVAAAA